MSNRHKNIYTTGQVAKICKVSCRTVAKWFDSGLIKGYRIPGSHDRRVTRASLVTFLVENGMPLGGLSQDVILHGNKIKAEALTALLPAGMEAKSAETVFCLAKMIDVLSWLVVLDFSMLPTDEREKTLASVQKTAIKAELIVLLPEDHLSPEETNRLSYLHHPVSVVLLAEKIRQVMSR